MLMYKFGTGASRWCFFGGGEQIIERMGKFDYFVSTVSEVDINVVRIFIANNCNISTMQLLNKIQRFSFATPRVYENFYDGKFVPVHASHFYEIYNPVTQEHIARVPQSSHKEFNEVVASAHHAFKTWSRVPLLSIPLCKLSSSAIHVRPCFLD
jgi:hypothetical protein